MIHPTWRATVAGAALAAALLLGGCSSSGSEGSSGTDAPTSTAPTTTRPAGPRRSGGPTPAVVFNGQGNNLDAYATTPVDGRFPTQRVDQTQDTDPEHGRDLNAQICFLPKRPNGDQWFIAGEDTNQDEPGGSPGWGIFRITGKRVGEFRITELMKLTPTYQPTDDGAENYGCGILSDGRLLTTDVGNQAGGPPNGQLTIYFPPYTGGTYPNFRKVASCKLDVGIGTAQSILVRDDVIYVASSRGNVFRYRGPFPTSNTASGGCGRKDPTGAPMADRIQKDTFIAAGPHGLATPAGLAPAPKGGFYVSSVISGVIDEFGPDGTYRRTILQPPTGEHLGAESYSTGTPLGIGVGPDGTLYYADIGVVVSKDGVGPGDHTGSVRRIRFVDGKPQAPETLATGLDFPDGIGVYVPTAS